MDQYQRPIIKTVIKRLKEPRRFLQVLTGPRQVGKTLLAHQVIDAQRLPYHFASADEPLLKDIHWLEQQWDIARLKAHRDPDCLLVLDEIQKIPHWSSLIKRLWDEDTRTGLNLKVILLGSSPLLIQQGLTESLAGRFELIPITHWSYPEMNKCFGWPLETYIYFGGYPGAAPLIKDQERWAHYIKDSLIETTISRDILLMSRIDKPALLRRLFHLSCQYSGQVLSFQKMLGQLHDAGNTTTLSHYLDLLTGAGMVVGIQKYAGQLVRQRASSPKLQILNTALMSALSPYTFNEARNQPDYWGRLTESAIGAHLYNTSRGTDIELYYWRERQYEVDFILKKGKKLVAIEVKSGLKKDSLQGMAEFNKQFKPHRTLQIGNHGLSFKEFFELAAIDLFI